MDRTTLDLRVTPPDGRAARRKSHRLGQVLLVLFCIPFVGFGLLAVNEGLARIGGESEDGVLLLIFGLVFAGLPALLFFGMRKGKQRFAREEELREQHPDEPWLGPDRWEGGRIRCENRAGMFVSWLFALVWNAISLPLVFAVPEELAKGNQAILIALLFPAAGLCMLVWAVRATLRWRRFGASVFEMTPMPGVLGGELEGALHMGTGLAGAHEVKLGVSCIRKRVTGSGKSRSTHEDLLWGDEQLVSGSALQRGPEGLMLPVRFALPYDAEPSDPVHSNDHILWRVDVSAEIPGVDYSAHFEVPVFRTDESDASRTMAALSRESGGDIPIADAPRSLELPVRPHPEGGMEILFPAGRRKLPALITSVIGAVFVGVTWICHAQGAPGFFTFLFGLIALGILYGALHLWLGSTRMRVHVGGVSIETRLLFLRSRHELARDEILSVLPESGMRSGNRVWWDLKIRTEGSPKGKRLQTPGVRVPAYLDEKRDADRLAAWVADQLGL